MAPRKKNTLATTIVVVVVVALLTNFASKGSLYQSADQFFANAARAGQQRVVFGVIGGAIALLGILFTYQGSTGKLMAASPTPQQQKTRQILLVVLGLPLVAFGLWLIWFGMTFPFSVLPS